MGLVEGHARKPMPNKWNKYPGTDTRKFSYYGWNVSNDHHTDKSTRKRRY